MAQKPVNGHDATASAALPGGPQRCANCHRPLTIEQVAEFLHCSVDTVRRVPKDRLRRFRKGKRNLYRLQDVNDYMDAYLVDDHPGTDLAHKTDDEVAPRNHDVVELELVDVSGRSPRRTS